MRPYSVRALWFVLLLTLGLFSSNTVQAQAITQSPYVNVNTSTNFISWGDNVRFNNIPYDPINHYETIATCRIYGTLTLTIYYSNGRVATSATVDSFDTNWVGVSSNSPYLSYTNSGTINPSNYISTFPTGLYSYRYTATGTATEYPAPFYVASSLTSTVYSSLYTLVKTR